MKVLTRDEYESLIRSGLQGMGVNPSLASMLIDARWPMFGPHVQAECRGRGLALEVEDLGDWLHEVIGEFWDDGERVDPMAVWLGPASVDSLVEWAVLNRRGRLRFSGEAATSNPEVVNRVSPYMKGSLN